MQTRTARRLVSLALAAMLATGSIATAFADGGGTASGNVLAGTTALAETDGGTFSFPSTHLTATDTTATMNVNTNVTDLRGTGAGWTLQLTMTQFTCSSDSTPTACASDETLPVTTVLNSSAACATSSTCTVPLASTVNCGLPNHAVSDMTSAVTLCAAADAGTGMGSADSTSTLKVSIPSGSYSGTYSSTVTLAFVS